MAGTGEAVARRQDDSALDGVVGVLQAERDLIAHARETLEGVERRGALMRGEADEHGAEVRSGGVLRGEGARSGCR
jgi:hypothetical protein